MKTKTPKSDAGPGEGCYVVCVIGTRITLDAVVAAYRRGDTPEVIAKQLGLRPPEVHAVVAFYLENKRVVKRYLDQRYRNPIDVKPAWIEIGQDQPLEWQVGDKVPVETGMGPAFETAVGCYLRGEAAGSIARHLRLRWSSAVSDWVYLLIPHGKLAEVHRDIASYLSNREKVDTYLFQRGLPIGEIQAAERQDLPARFASQDSMLKALECAWQDHFQTRVQTWKPLEIEAVMALSMVGADLRYGDTSPALTLVLAFLLAAVAVLGFKVTRHHRGVERKCFRSIQAIEERLGISDPIHKPPKEIGWLQIIDPSKSSTPLFILRVHCIVIIFALAYPWLGHLARAHRPTTAPSAPVQIHSTSAAQAVPCAMWWA